MTEGLRIGHLTDLHLKGKPSRRERLVRGLEKARALGVHHLLLTGDLTSSGKPSQFLELAACLSSWPSDRLTVIPGNHDEGSAFDQALLSGCLSRFLHTSKGVVRVGELRILPVDTRFPRRALAFKAVGLVGASQLGMIASELRTPGPILIAAHHGPQLHPMHLFDGMVDRKALIGLLESREDVHVASGHDHRILDLGRVHVAASVAHHDDPLRTYLVRDGKITTEYKAGERGNYFSLGGLRYLDGRGL